MLNRLFKKNIEDFKARDLMTKAVITAMPSDNLLVVQNLMSRYRIKKVVIVDSKIKSYPVGIVTTKDIIKFLISDQTDRELHEIPVGEAMTRSLTTTNKDTGIVNCATVLLEHGNILSSLIVVEEDYLEELELPLDKKMRLSGILTSTDFSRFFSENCRGVSSVKDHMSESFFTISINEKVLKAAELMEEKNISRIVVVASKNQSDELLGILTETDISRVILAIRSETLRSVYEYLQIIFFNDCCEYIFHFTKHGNVMLDKLADDLAVPYQDKSNIGRYSELDRRDRGNTWFIGYETIKSKSERPHPATFPVDLPTKCIRLHGLRDGLLVLDPFCGIGSTAIACAKLGISSIGFDVDRDYLAEAARGVNRVINSKNTK